MSFLCRNSIQIASPSSILCDIFCSVTGRVAYHGEDPALGRVHPPGRAPQPLKMPPHRFSTDTRKNLWLGDSPLFRPVASRGSRLHASRPTRGQGGLSRTPWLLAIVLLSLWQCLPSHGLTWLQLLCTIRVWTGECMERGPGALTPHVSIGVSICRHMRAALSLWLAQRSTWWLFPEAPPDL